ncbi:PREDICTED: carboxylesterase 4A [Lipotes vexillifer]|uniref:Carboxylesterase 4A n=1 Tax=Lipotes vexillifer TaxID=118797 RepID=A0A340X7Q5_LIPVE|nr:PREDICTED: carboxylesterase 4A [Lipotes vexillifer]
MNIEFFQKPPRDAVSQQGEATLAGHTAEEKTKAQRDSGVSIFFYEFQHRPSSFAKIKPAWVRAGHGAEKTFIFGSPFLMDESSMPGALHTKEPLVVTNYGTPPRKQVHVGKTPINAFLGVPFYRPPVGACRFTAPEPPEPWEGIRDATTYAPVCLQESWGQFTSMYFNTHKKYKWLHFSEDCLYPNVYVPVGALRDPLLPVMVWFPGHAFLVGSASTYDGSELAAREKVVPVLLHHSLGVLGFLSTGDSQARGNWAPLDQVAALRWVPKNIAAFGGDPGWVTWFGQSSGAMCFSGLVTSPPAWGLFQQAISQSGTAVLRVFITSSPG